MSVDANTMDLILRAVLSLIAIVITGVVIPWIKGKIGEQKFSELEQYTELAVRTAEMLFTIEEYKKKKEYVLKYVTNKASEIGLNLTVDDLEVMIEGWVNAVKRNAEYTELKEN